MKAWHVLGDENKSFQRKGFIVLTVLLFITLLVCAAKHDNDYFTYTARGDDFSLSGKAARSAEEFYGVLTISDIQEDTVSLKLGDIVLDPGSYTYDFQYELKGKEAQLEMYSGSYLFEDNRSGNIFFSVDLQEEKSAAYGSFEVDQHLEDVQFSVIVPKGASFSIGRFTLNSDTVKNNDSLIFAGIAIVVYLFLIWTLFTKRTLCKTAIFQEEAVSGKRICLLVFFIVSIIAIYASIPLFSADLSGGYDLLYHVNRIEGLAKSLRCGQFPVRIHSGILNGYGYPNGIFYPELLLYFPAVLRLLGMSLMNCYKVLAIASSWMTALVGYWSFSKLLGSRTIGMLAAVLYTINPYRLACIYERSAVGEYLAMIFLPAVLYGMYAVLFGEKKDWKWLCFGATGVLQCHVLTTEIAAAVCIITFLIFIPRLFNAEKRWLSLFKAGLSTILLNLWFLVPFVLMALQLNISVFGREPQLSINAISSLHELFSMSYLRQLRPNDSGVSNNGIGFVFLLALALFVLYSLLKRTENPASEKLFKMGRWLALLGMFTAFAATDLFPWDKIQSIHFISKIVGSLQFPFRLFSITMTCFSGLAGIVVLLWAKRPKERIIAALVVASVAVFSATIYLEPVNTYISKPHLADQHQFPIQTSTTEGIALGEYVPGSSSVIDMLTRGTNVEVSNSGIHITGLRRNGTSMSFDYVIETYNTEENYYLLAPLTYYPTYRAEINGKNYTATPGGNNYVKIDLPEQSGHVELNYRQPWSFVAAAVVSAVSLAVFILNFLFPQWYVKIAKNKLKKLF